MRFMPKIIPLIIVLRTVGLASPALAADGFWKRSYEPDQPISKIENAISRFNKFDEEASTNTAAIPDYIRSGIVLSDLACENWLDTLGRTDRDASFAKDVLNIVGNLIIGIAGINGANPGSLARGSVGLAAGNASIDAFKNEVILGSISDIEAKLNEGRKITAATIKSYIPTTTNYDDAKGLLIAYHRDCSPAAIKNLLKTSLAAVKYEPADTTLGGEVAKAKAAALTAKLSKEIYPNTGKMLNDDDLYKLYLAKIMQPGDSSFIDSMIPGDAQKLSEDFSSGNEPQRLELLQDIAILKRFDTRYKVDKLAAQKDAEKEKEIAKAQTEAAAQKVVNAQKALPPADAAKVANTPELKQFFARPETKALTPELMEQLSNRSSAIATAKNTPSAKNLAQATRNLEEKKAQEDNVKAKAAAIAAAPEPKPATDAAKTLVGPVSVNAVLVPATQTK